MKGLLPLQGGNETEWQGSSDAHEHKSQQVSGRWHERVDNVFHLEPCLGATCSVLRLKQISIGFSLLSF
jgi:hypothetical protein